MHLCIYGCVSLCACVWLTVRGELRVSPIIALSLSPLRQDLSLTGCLLLRLDLQWALGICLILLTSAGVTGICDHAWFLCGCWAFKHRFSCLHSKCVYPLNRPFNFIYFSWVRNLIRSEWREKALKSPVGVLQKSVESSRRVWRESVESSRRVWRESVESSPRVWRESMESSRRVWRKSVERRVALEPGGCCENWRKSLSAFGTLTSLSQRHAPWDIHTQETIIDYLLHARRCSSHRPYSTE